MFYTAHGAYSGSWSSCRNLERVVLVSESTVYRLCNASGWSPHQCMPNTNGHEYVIVNGMQTAAASNFDPRPGHCQIATGQSITTT